MKFQHCFQDTWRVISNLWLNFVQEKDKLLTDFTVNLWSLNNVYNRKFCSVHFLPFQNDSPVHPAQPSPLWVFLLCNSLGKNEHSQLLTTRAKNCTHLYSFSMLPLKSTDGGSCPWEMPTLLHLWYGVYSLSLFFMDTFSLIHHQLRLFYQITPRSLQTSSSAEFGFRESIILLGEKDIIIFTGL